MIYVQNWCKKRVKIKIAPKQSNNRTICIKRNQSKLGYTFMAPICHSLRAR
jgi:hypothetical protein